MNVIPYTHCFAYFGVTIQTKKTSVWISVSLQNHMRTLQLHNSGRSEKFNKMRKRVTKYIKLTLGHNQHYS